MKSSRYSLIFCVTMAFVIFTVLSLAGMAENFLGFSGRPSRGWEDFWWGFWGWNSWVPTVPVAYWLVKKHLDGKSKTRRIVLYIVLGTLLVVAYKAFILEWLYRMMPYNRWSNDFFWESVLYSLISRKSVFEVLIFWFLLSAIYALQYSQLLKVRELRETQLETELAQAHISALKMQLQPHFLFNTLNSISSLLREKVDPNQLQANMLAADSMITNLSEMFRHTLKTADLQMIPLRDEISFLDNYLDIEQVRFSDRLSIEKQIDPKLNSVEVPALLLQPIVENAIRHGIAKSSSPGFVRIRIHKQDDRLVMMVQDNGQCSEQDLNHAFQKGVGLQNTIKRLQHLYGDLYSFHLRKNTQHETEAVVVIPLPSHHDDSNGEPA